MTTAVEFQAWPKTPRLFREIVITEKIDGTNAAVHITEDGQVFAQSRKRLITPEADNFGFARWAADNASYLADTLGPGLHFGEWWGKGIQRGYGMEHRVFSLFNTSKEFEQTAELRRVPVLYQDYFSEEAVEDALIYLTDMGSEAAPGFRNPEGICVFHTQSRHVYKVTLDNNDSGKWELGA